MRIVIKLDYQGAITGPGNFNRGAFKGVNLRICQNDRDRGVYLPSSPFFVRGLKDLGRLKDTTVVDRKLFVSISC